MSVFKISREQTSNGLWNMKTNCRLAMENKNCFIGKTIRLWIISCELNSFKHFLNRKFDRPSLKWVETVVQIPRGSKTRGHQLFAFKNSEIELITPIRGSYKPSWKLFRWKMVTFDTVRSVSRQHIICMHMIFSGPSLNHAHFKPNVSLLLFGCFQK